MDETRAGKYGRFLALWINYTINTIPPRNREQYRANFIKELRDYSFEPRKKGQPRNSGCNLELEDMAEINPQSPEELARLIKEGIHLMYQKQTAAKVMTSLLKHL
jgi:hypothetical protein